MARSKAGSHREDDRRPVREPGTPARARTDWTVVAVFAAALVSVLPVIVNEFANDDILLVETNGRIQQLSRWREIFTMPYWPPPFSPDLYRPLLTLAHVAEYLVGGGAAVVFRVVSMLLFAGVAACLYRFVEERTERVAAIGAVALFIVHPVHVETVTLAVAQNEIAIAFLALASTWFYVRHRAEGRLTLRAWTALATMYAAAALLKESGFVLPAFWAAAEFTLVERPAPKQVWPGFAAMAVLGAGLFGLRARVLHDPVGTFQAPALVGLDARGRALTMLSVVPQWLRLLVFPAHLRADYSPQEFNAVQTVTGVVLLGAGILGGAVFAAVRYLGSLGRFGLLWIAIALLPVSNVVIPTGILITERSLFLPSVGAVIILAEVFTRTQLFQVRYARLATAAVVLAGFARSFERFRVWRNEGMLTVRTVKDAPLSYRAQRDYGNTLYQIGWYAESEQAYRTAIRLAPPHEVWQVHNELAEKYADRGRDSLALRELQASLASNPNQDRTRAQVVVTELRLGEYARAHVTAEEAVRAGGSTQVYGRLEKVADSAEAVKAPVESIRIGLVVASPVANALH
jgi:tetratricopeptide (TPR) repeat protein